MALAVNLLALLLVLGITWVGMRWMAVRVHRRHGVETLDEAAWLAMAGVR